MKKWFISALVCFLFFPAAADDGLYPEWINRPSRGCMMDEICVIGSGETLNKAKADAQNEMLKFFENHIESSYSSAVSSDNDDVYETASESVVSVTKGIISGSLVKRTYFDAESNTYYAQVSMNKEEAKDNLRTEMLSLDRKMETLLNDGKASSFAGLKELYARRDELNRRYAFLNKGVPLKERVTYDQVFAKKKLDTKDKFVGVNIVGPEGKRISASLKKMLTENGLKVSSSAYNYELKGELTVEREHMNVKGFIKNFYTFNLEAVDLAGDLVGSIYVTTSETGRDEKQALNKALSRIIEEIKDNFDDLGI